MTLLTHTPVLATEFHVAGYEFTLAPVPTDDGRIPESPGPDDMQLIQAVVDHVAPRLANRRESWFAIEVSFLTESLLLHLPGRSASVIVWTGGVLPFPDMLDAARAIRARGCRIGIVAPERSDVEEAWAPVIDFLAIDVLPLGMAARDAIDALRQRHPEKLIVARGVENESVGRGSSTTADFISGPLLVKGESVTPPGGLSARQQRLRDGMNAVHRRDWGSPPLQRLDLDPGVVRRLWPFLSAAGDRNSNAPRIGDVEALSPPTLYRLLAMYLYVCDGAFPVHWATLEQALIRGRMMELLGARFFDAAHREALFITGLLLLLGSAVQSDLWSLFSGVDLQDHVGDALRRRSGPLAACLHAACSTETRVDLNADAGRAADARWRSAEEALLRAHVEAIHWAAAP